MTFWEHLEELRGCFLRILVAVAAAGTATFCCKGWLFAAVFAPQDPLFVANRVLDKITGTQFHVDLVNIDLTQQFLTHLKMSMWVGLLLIMPYIIYLLFHFVAPALYQHERRYTLLAFCAGYLLFMTGVALNYFVIFPATFRFLAGYQVSSDVPNTISLTSYISTLLVMSLTMGIVFELPVLCWLLAKMGILSAEFMMRYRKHAIVVILIIAAIITPTGDPFTLTIVSLPIYLLFELSVLIARRANTSYKT